MKKHTGENQKIITHTMRDLEMRLHAESIISQRKSKKRKLDIQFTVEHGNQMNKLPNRSKKLSYVKKKKYKVKKQKFHISSILKINYVKIHQKRKRKFCVIITCILFKKSVLMKMIL